MNYITFQIGSSVCIISYGPYRGLRGTIQGITEHINQDKTFNFYLVGLEGKNIVEYIWFQYEDLGSVCLREVNDFSDIQRNPKGE